MISIVVLLVLFALHLVCCNIMNTIAGTGVAGLSGDGSSATSARLNGPLSLTVDSSGNAYIADYFNHRIRLLNSTTGIASTLAGSGGTGITSGNFSGDSGAATSARLFLPSGVAVDLLGNVYIADSYNHRIRKVMISTGIISTIAGTGTASLTGDGDAATSATLNYPRGIAVDSSGNYYFTDTTNHRIRMVNVSTGIIWTIVGTGNVATYNGDGITATSATLNNPQGLTLDSSGNLYFTDRDNYRIRFVNMTTGMISTIAGTGTASYSGDGSAATSAALNQARGVALDSSGNVYIADTSNQRIRKVTVSTGIISTIAGTGASSYNGDNIAATSATLNRPSGVSLDSFDNVFIADSSNNRVRKVTTSVTSPTSQPSNQPSSQPTSQPSSLPSSQPTTQPSSQPSSSPTCPSTHPTSQPTSQPSMSTMEVVVFSVTTKYQNLDLSDWNVDQAHHEALIKASLVQHVDGLREDDIVDISAANTSTTGSRHLTNNDDGTTEIHVSSSIDDPRVLIIKILELDITFNIRLQYFNQTTQMTSADVYQPVISRIIASSNDSLVYLQSNSAYFANAVVLSTSYSSYSVIISRSTYPTSTPTSQPSCGIGSYQVGSGCGSCAPGYYTDSLNAYQCNACPLDTYKSEIGSVQCSPCGKFTTNVNEASTSCPNFLLNVSAITYCSICAFVAVLFLSSLYFAGENKFIMLMLGTFPLLDILSDMIYILSVKFWNFELFLCAVIFFVIPSSMFVHMLVRIKAYPRMIKFVGVEIIGNQYIWLSVSREGSPLINGERSTLSFEEHDGMDKVLWYWSFWLVLIALQVIFLIVCFLWYLVQATLLIVWLFAGLVLYQTKMLAIGKVWNTWFSTWTQSNDLDKEISLDASVLNESMFHEFMLETVPQIAIQSLNNLLIYNGNYPIISQFSLAMSLVIAINGIYRYGYYLLWRGIKFDEIPLPLVLRIQKINKSNFLPRRSVVTRKLESFVESIKIKRSFTTSNMRRISQAWDDSTTSSEVIAAIVSHLEIGIGKLRSMPAVSVNDCSEHLNQFEELVVELRNIVSESESTSGRRSWSNETNLKKVLPGRIKSLKEENEAVKIYIDHWRAGRLRNKVAPFTDQMEVRAASDVVDYAIEVNSNCDSSNVDEYDQETTVGFTVQCAEDSCLSEKNNHEVRGLVLQIEKEDNEMELQVVANSVSNESIVSNAIPLTREEFEESKTALNRTSNDITLSAPQTSLTPTKGKFIRNPTAASASSIIRITSANDPFDLSLMTSLMSHVHKK